MEHRHGTRFEFFLTSSEGAARALYRVVVAQPPEADREVIVEITPHGATLVGDGAGIEPARLQQLLALAKTLGKRADDAPWPRRINRWRQPGVR